MTFDWAILVEYWPVILHGLGLTLAASLIGIACGLMVGLVIALMRMSRTWGVPAIAAAYIELGRNLPFMIIAFLIFYGLPRWGIQMPAFLVGAIALSLYAGAYFAEIIRAAIQSVPKGQMESARAMGMSRFQSLRHVIFPQMMGFFLPPATNQAIMVVKESSILSTITVAELTMAGQIIQGYTYSPVEAFVTAAILYWLTCAAVSRLGSRLEVALQPYRRLRIPAPSAAASEPGRV
jgi:His/Glu/Gln/Arg/opine family amino acid ABC transporter permease subunit